LEDPPEEVKPKTMEQVKREEELVKKALAGKLVEKPAKEVPPRGPGVRTYNVFVDDAYYSVDVEAVGGAPVITEITPIQKPAPAPQPEAAKPSPAPAPAAEKAEEAPAPVEEGDGVLAAPMPGMIVEVKCDVGDTVAAGDEVLILEAMKMQNPLTSPIDGAVKSIKVKAGDSVDSGDVLIVIA
jgi:biotin carboxyl carrier protein